MNLSEEQLDFTGYEFALGSVFGVRRFRVDRLGRLTGVHVRDVWTPGENVATCRTYTFRFAGVDEVVKAPADKPHGATPADTCPCGFYAFTTLTDTRWTPDDGPYVEGVIEGYGRTVIGTKGFRCEKARIVAVIIPPAPKTVSWLFTARWLSSRRRKLAREIHDLYPDVYVTTHRRRALNRFPIHEGTRPSPDTDPDFWSRTS